MKEYTIGDIYSVPGGICPWGVAFFSYSDGGVKIEHHGFAVKVVEQLAFWGYSFTFSNVRQNERNWFVISYPDQKVATEGSD